MPALTRAGEAQSQKISRSLDDSVAVGFGGSLRLGVLGSPASLVGFVFNSSKLSSPLIRYPWLPLALVPSIH